MSRISALARRELAALAAGAIAWPALGRAQTAPPPLVGYISGAFAETAGTRMQWLRKGLAEAGYAEGRGVRIAYHWAQNRMERVPGFVTELLRDGAKVIIADSTPVILAARPALGDAAAVFLIGSDPVRIGLVRSLNSPGVNMTGVVMLNTQLTQKRAELLHEVVPDIRTIGLLGHHHNPNFPTHVGEMATAARARGLALKTFSMRDERDFEPAFRELAQTAPAALVVQADPWLDARVSRLIALAANYRIPAIYQWREQVEAGGLVSYGVSILDGYRQVGAMAGEILGGRKASTLPVQQSVKIEMLINVKTAKVLGLKIPEATLLRADEVIE
jgi:putative ABC transport system substrate-binding protein